MFSNTLSFLSSRSVSDQVSHPYKTTGKITFLYIFIFIFLDSNLEFPGAGLIILFNGKDRNCVKKIPPALPIFHDTNPDPGISPRLFKIHFNIILSSTPQILLARPTGLSRKIVFKRFLVVIK